MTASGSQLFGRNYAFLSQTAADDICGNGIYAGLGDAVIAVKLINTRNRQIALKSLLAAQMRLLRNPVFEGAAKRASLQTGPGQRMRLFYWL